jgi:hypothetical protein
LASKGLRTLTLKGSKSRTLRVTTVKSWTRAVAAIMASLDRVFDLRLMIRPFSKARSIHGQDLKAIGNSINPGLDFQRLRLILEARYLSAVL